MQLKNLITLWLILLFTLSSTLLAKEYTSTSYYVAYNTADKAQYALVMPLVNKVYTHEAGYISDLKQIDTQFKTFPTYDNGELCFSALIEGASGEDGASVMEGQCYNVNFFYTQKEAVEGKGMAFILTYTPLDKVYEGLAGDATSFKVVKEGEEVFNDNSMSGDDYTSFIFDVVEAKALILTEAPLLNTPPVANAGTDQVVEVNQAVTVTGTASDTDGTVVSYEWKISNTVLSADLTFSYIPTTVGTDILTLTVIDDDGAITSDFMILTIIEAPNTTPTIATLDLSYDYTTFWKQIVWDLEADTYVDAQYLYSVIPNTDQCDMGTLSEEAKQRASLVMNYTRELHGLVSLEYNYLFDDQVQASALIMKANNTMTHHPSSDSLCYTQEGYTGSSTSNIYFGNNVVDPVEHIIGWMDDAYNVSLVSAVGHRRWMLNPFGNYLAYGQNEGFGALKVFDFDQTFNIDIDIDYVAFPYKRYPYIFISNNPEKPTPWSFSIVEKKDNYSSNSFDYFEHSSVEVRDKISGVLLDTSNVYDDKLNYGLSNILTWEITDWQYDSLYEVTIASVHMQSGEMKSFTYDVYIDYKNIVTIIRPNENGDHIDEANKMSGMLYNQKDEDSFVVNLSGTKVFTGSNSAYSNMGFFINLYDSDKRLIKASDVPFTMTGLNGNYTIVISHSSKEDGYYYTADNTVYTVEMTN